MQSDFRWHSFLVSAGYLPDTKTRTGSSNLALPAHRSQLASANKIHYLKIVYTIRPKKKRHNII